MNDFIKNLIQKLSGTRITDSEVSGGISETREISTPDSREITSKKPAADSLACPYCGSAKFVRRGLRAKKHEKVQLYLCKSCRKTFTPQITKGKHYPLAVMLDAISIYNLGYGLEETCRIVNFRANKPQQNSYFGSWSTPAPEQSSVRGRLSTQPKSESAGLGFTSEFSEAENSGESQQKTRLAADFSDSTRIESDPDCHLENSLTPKKVFVNRDVEVGEFASPGSQVTIRIPYSSTPTSPSLYTMQIQPSTLSNWISETEPLCRYCQMRPYYYHEYESVLTNEHECANGFTRANNLCISDSFVRTDK